MKRILRVLLRLLPLRNMIIFESHGDYCDNSRTLYEYMISKEMNKKYKMIWLVQEPERFSNYKIKNVIFIDVSNRKFLSKIKHFYYLAVAKYAFYSHRTPIRKLNRGEVFVNLWHGTGIKNPNFLDLGKNFDYVIYSSDFFKESFIKSLSCKSEQLLPLGNIRNDLLFKKSNSLEKIVGKTYKQTIIWMPTFRKHKNGHKEFESEEILKFGVPIVKTDRQLDEINSELEKREQLLLIKLHPAQDMSGIDINSYSNIMLLLNEDLDAIDIELYELISQVDALLTDVSSVYVDYLLLNRPIGFTIDDSKEYLTGFFFDNVIDYLPGEHIEDFSGLIKYIDNIYTNTDNYVEDRNRVNEQFNFYKHGEWAKRAVETFIK